MKTKAVRLHGEKDVRMDEVTLPELRDDAIMIKIICDAICMSSWKAIQQGSRHLMVPEDVAENPAALGHELCGIVVKAGSKWADKYPIGAKVAVKPGKPGQIGGLIGYSFPYYGGAMEYSIVHDNQLECETLVPVEGDSFFKLALSEPIFCNIGGVEACYHVDPVTRDHIMGIRKGGKTIIMGGCGPMGLGAINYILAMEDKPAMLVVTEINQDRLDHAKHLMSPEDAAKVGIELHYVNTADMEDEIQELMDLTGGTGYDDVLLYTPVRHIAEVGDKIVAKDGCMCLFAGPYDRNFSSEINLYNCHYNGVKVIGVAGGTVAQYEKAIKYIEEGRVKPEVMVTHIGGLNAYQDTVCRVPEIPGGKKLIYNHIEMPLTAIDDFAELGKEDPLFAALADACDKNRGLWCKEAEDILLKHFHVL